MMKLSTLDFVKLLPQFMRNDSAVQGLAAGINRIVPQLAASVANLSTWDHIDDLTEAELDALAWELNVFWYDYDAAVEVKRDLVKNSDSIHRHMGTKWAVENVISSYYGDGRVVEWFTYGGEPGHFRVVSSNPSISKEKFDEFVSIINKVKRASTKFDGVYLETGGSFEVAAGVAFHDVAIEQHTARVPDDLESANYLYALGEDDTLVVTMTATISADGDAIVIDTPLLVDTDGDAITINS